MSRANDPAMHAPGFQLSHCLPPAGVGRPMDLDLYRFNRVVPLYTPDPCIGPSDGQLICPPDCGNQKRNDVMPWAGVDLPESDSFQFYDTRQGKPKQKPACRCSFFANQPPCSSLGPVSDPLTCPCINSPENPAPGPARAPPSHPMQQTFNGPFHQPAGQCCDGIYDYYVNNRPLDTNTLNKIPLCPTSRQGAIAPTPHMMNMGPEDGTSSQRRGQQEGGGGGGAGKGGWAQNKIINVGGAGNCVSYHCQNPYFPSNYLCRPVFDRKYLDDCPEQNGPHPDNYTFL